MKNLLFIFMTSMILISCEKEPVLEYTTYKTKENVITVEDNLKKFPLKILWYKRLHTEQASTYHTPSDAMVHLDEGGLSVFYDFNRFSYWSIANGDNLTNTTTSIGYGYDTYYHPALGGIISSHKKIISVDKFGNETLLYSAPDSIYINSHTNLHGDDYYFYDFDYSEGTCALYKLNVVNKQCELVSLMDGEKLWGDNFRATIQLPVFFTINAEEYELSSFTKSTGTVNNITYSSCKRLSDGSIIWEKDDLISAYPGSIIVHNGDIILNGGGHICKVELTTGNKVWEILPSSPGYYSPNDLTATGAKIWGDKLMFFSQGSFRELDMYSGIITYTGSVLKYEYDNPSIVIANGIAYWSDYNDGKSSLIAMRLSDHSIVFKGSNPYYGIEPYGSNVQFLTGNMKVDTAKNIGYISDGYFIYCLELL